MKQRGTKLMDSPPTFARAQGRGNDGRIVGNVIPAKAAHDQGACPRCRAGNFDAVPATARSSSVNAAWIPASAGMTFGVVIPAEAGIHESRGGRGTSIQAGIHGTSTEHGCAGGPGARGDDDPAGTLPTHGRRCTPPVRRSQACPVPPA